MLPCWAVGFVLLCKARSDLFLFNEILLNAVTLLVVAAALPGFGVTAAAVAFPVGRLVSLVVVTIMARRLAGFAWSRAVVVHCAAIVAGCVAILVAQEAGESAAATVGLALALGYGAVALRCLWRMLDLGAWLSSRFPRRR
jgi:hypothetical protein